jgi:hypothetical protein
MIGSALRAVMKSRFSTGHVISLWQLLGGRWARSTVVHLRLS